MKLEKWALIAEVLGGVAILISLVVLIFEVRENTELAKLSAYEAVTRDLDEWRRDVLNNPKNMALFFAYPAEIPPVGTEEQMRLNMLLLNQWTSLERAYYAHEAGVISDDRWDRMEGANCREYLRVPEFYRDILFLRVTDDFRQYLEESCE